MHLSDFLIRDAIITDLQATTKEEAIREIVRSVQHTGHLAGVDTETLTRAFMEREKLAATAIGKGVACPHGGHESVDRVFGTIALSRPGVEFNSFDGKPVHIILLLFHTADQFGGGPMRPGDIYDAGKAFVRFHEDDRSLDRLRQCRTGEEVFDLIVEGDREATDNAGRALGRGQFRSQVSHLLGWLRRWKHGFSSLFRPRGSSPKIVRAIEPVLALAFGFGFAWLEHRWNPFWQQVGHGQHSFLFDHVGLHGSDFLCGVGLVAGLGLAVEMLRGRSPKAWGVGRWVWAIASLYMILALTRDILLDSPPRPDQLLWSLMENGRSDWNDLVPFLISLWITARFVGLPSDPRLDAREWCGRAFAFLILIQNAFESTVFWWLRSWRTLP